MKIGFLDSSPGLEGLLLTGAQSPACKGGTGSSVRTSSLAFHKALAYVGPSSKGCVLS